MKRLYQLMPILAALFMSGCISLDVPMEQIPGTQRTAKPETGKALVYFVRATDYAKDYPVDLYDDETYIGTILYGEYLAYQAKPGKRLFTVTGKVLKTAEIMAAEVAAGKTYYMLVTPHIGWENALVIRFHLKPQNGDLSQDKIDNAIGASKEVKAGPAARDYAKTQKRRMMNKRIRAMEIYEKSEKHQGRGLRAESGR